MELKSIEETKKKYEDEIHRLSKLGQQMEVQYRNEYEALKSQENKLLDEYSTQMQRINIGIERLRGAYTALVDLEEGKVPSLVENGMLKDVEIEDTDVTDNAENTDGELVEEQSVESKEPSEQLAQLHKNYEPAQQKASEKVSEELKEVAHELVKEAKEKGKVTKYEDFAKTDLAKETALTPEEVEALKSVTENLDTEVKETPKEIQQTETESKVNEADVPDYLKGEYGITNK